MIWNYIDFIFQQRICFYTKSGTLRGPYLSLEVGMYVYTACQPWIWLHCFFDSPSLLAEKWGLSYEIVVLWGLFIYNSTLKFEEKSCFVVFFHEWNEWKNPQFNFSSQNLSIERNFFKWDGKVTKIWHLLFHRIWKNYILHCNFDSKSWFHYFSLRHFGFF